MKLSGNLSWKLNNYGVIGDNETITPTEVVNIEPEAPIKDTFLFGVDVAGLYAEHSLSGLIALEEKLSTAREAYQLLRSTIQTKSTLPEITAELSKIDDSIAAMNTVSKQIDSLKNGIDIASESSTVKLAEKIKLISGGIQVASNIYSTGDILYKTINGKATTTDKEKYIANGVFSIFNLTSIITSPAVEATSYGYVLKSAGLVGLGYSALQIGAAWGELYYGVSVTGSINDAVHHTLFNIQCLDNIARNIFDGARSGKTWEEMKATESIIAIKNITVKQGISSINDFSSANFIAILATGNVKARDDAASLINDTIKLVNSNQYSDSTYKNLYYAGRQAYFAKKALDVSIN